MLLSRAFAATRWPARALSLSLSNNAISSVHLNAFEGMRSLRVLDLSRNRIDSLPANTLEPCHSLTHLFLNHNRLARLEAFFFVAAHLTFLDMSRNQVAEFNEATLPSAGPAALVALHLEQNGMSRITSNALSHLAHLNVLVLAQNSLRSLPDNVFDPCPNLVTLDLSANQFTDARAIRRLANVPHVMLSLNRLVTLPGPDIDRAIDPVSGNINISGTDTKNYRGTGHASDVDSNSTASSTKSGTYSDTHAGTGHDKGSKNDRNNDYHSKRQSGHSALPELVLLLQRGSNISKNSRTVPIPVNTSETHNNLNYRRTTEDLKSQIVSGIDGSQSGDSSNSTNTSEDTDILKATHKSSTRRLTKASKIINRDNKSLRLPGTESDDFILPESSENISVFSETSEFDSKRNASGSYETAIIFNSSATFEASLIWNNSSILNYSDLLEDIAALNGTGTFETSVIFNASATFEASLVYNDSFIFNDTEDYDDSSTFNTPDDLEHHRVMDASTASENSQVNGTMNVSYTSCYNCDLNEANKISDPVQTLNTPLSKDNLVGFDSTKSLKSKETSDSLNIISSNSSNNGNETTHEKIPTDIHNSSTRNCINETNTSPKVDDVHIDNRSSDKCTCTKGNSTSEKENPSISALPLNLIDLLWNFKRNATGGKHRSKNKVCSGEPGFPAALQRDFSSNGITRVAPDAFRGFCRLRRLNLADNVLRRLPLTMLGEMPHLADLDVSGNNISRLDFLKSAGPALTVLDASRNALRTVPRRVFTSVYALEVLDLSVNCIVWIKPGTMSHLRRLEKLSFAHNYLKQIPRDLLDYSTLLVAVDFSHNLLVNLPFLCSDSVQVLDLSFNHIRRLPAGSFLRMPRLTHLDLGDNEIDYMDSMSFDGLNKLKYLNLAMNRINELPGNFLVPMKSLKALSVARNMLSRLNNQTFNVTNENQLEELDLSGNHLNVIHSRAFQYLSELKMFNLSYNRIQYLAEDMFCANTELVEFDLSQNIPQTSFRLEFTTPLLARNALIKIARSYFSHDRFAGNIKRNAEGEDGSGGRKVRSDYLDYIEDDSNEDND